MPLCWGCGGMVIVCILIEREREREKEVEERNLYNIMCDEGLAEFIHMSQT